MSTLPALADLPWEGCFTTAIYQRGLRYAAKGHVKRLERTDPDGLQWAATVQGSGGAAYRCAAELRPGSDPLEFRLSDRCTCPMGGGCKHVVAMLCVVRATLRTRAAAGSGTAAAPAAVPDPLAAWTPWLQRLQARTTAEAAEAPTAHVGLLLRAAAYGQPPRLLAAVAAFRLGQKGQPVEPRVLRLVAGAPDAAPAQGWNEQELLALGVLLDRQSERSGALYYAAIDGRAQEQALAVLTRRLPLYFERGSRPLTLGPARRLALQWEEQDDGSQRLRCIDPERRPLQLLKADSIWYLDSERAEFGRIEDGAALLDLADFAPPLPPEHSAALRQRLQQAGLPLPLPAACRAPTRLQVAPVPSLLLRTVQGLPNYWERKHESAPVGAAQLAFDYDGFRVALNAPASVRRRRHGELVEIVRDRAAEDAWQQRLDALDLLPARRLPYPLSHVYGELPADTRLLAPGAKRQPLAPEHWADTLRRLHEAGVHLHYAAGFPRPLREIAADAFDAELAEAGGHWFALALGIDIEGERHDLLPILRRLLADPRFPLQRPAHEAADARWRLELDDARALSLPLGKLRALIAPLLDWLQQDGPLRLHRSQRETLAALPAQLHWRGDTRLRQRLLELGRRASSAKSPAGFKAKLRPYQRQGLAWLETLAEAGLGGVLADDMGLGKTVQVLAHLQAARLRSAGRHRTLVVAPTSLMGNWQDEAARFAPALKTLLLHGTDRGDRYDRIASHELILTTYPLLARDRERLLAHEFDLLVLDEAQTVKNARSQAAQVVRELRAKRRLAMTGTPLENHLGELWAQFDTVEPGLLGSERDFARFYRTPIEKHGDDQRRQRLSRRIAPLLLRRRKDEVLAELPPKTEIVRTLELDGGQRELYETLRLAQHRRVREAVAARGLAQSGIVVLDALLKLRQACCDPRLLKLPAARQVKESAKLDALLELLDTALDEGRRVLLFSQFTGMLDLIEAALGKRRIAHLRLDGDTPGGRRAGIVRAFQHGEAPLMLISLKAGGVGLNLTAADTVIHYDPWWNPAVEQQATDRAHRIGQDKPVFVYKLICQGTVEEKILALQTRKAELAQAVLEGGRSTQLKLTEQDLAELFAPLR